MDAKELSKETIKAALEAARRRSNELEAHAAEMLKSRDALAHEIQLLEKLLSLKGGEVDGAPRQPAPVDVPNRGDSPALAGGPGPKGRPAVSAAIQELERAGRPLHISELMRALEERGVEIPGAGQQANLIAHLSRSAEIVRPARGMYGLSSWGLDDVRTLKPAARRRVRGRSRTKRP